MQNVCQFADDITTKSCDTLFKQYETKKLIWFYPEVQRIIYAKFLYDLNKTLQVDEDSLGGFWELAKEGFGSAFATFMVSWIGVYSASHFNWLFFVQEQKV